MRLGLGEHFWNGDIDAAFRHQLAPSGVTLDQLRAEPAGVRVPLTTRHRKYAELDGDVPRGLRTPSGKIELYFEVLAEHGYPPLPEFEEPRTSPVSRPDLAERFPLILTCAKRCGSARASTATWPACAGPAPDPQVEQHPQTAAARGIAAGDWVRLDTPHGSNRARAKLNFSLDPQVVCGQHGWWQACVTLGCPVTRPSARTAPTSTWCCVSSRAIRSAAAHRCARRSATSSRWPRPNSQRRRFHDRPRSAINLASAPRRTPRRVRPADPAPRLRTQRTRRQTTSTTTDTRPTAGRHHQPPLTRRPSHGTELRIDAGPWLC